MKAQWQVREDDTNYKEVRKVGPRQYQFITMTDMVDACGRDASKDEPFVWELYLVDLDVIPRDVQESAAKCCDLDSWFPPHIGEGHEKLDDTLRREMAVAECCHDYGAKAPLGMWSGKSGVKGGKLHREARREASQLLAPKALAKAMARPVNGIGSTATEFMAGDIFSAMQRGAESGDPKARLMAKVYGVPQDVIDDTRPEDWLPYFSGYMRAMGGGDNDATKDYSPEYTRGYDRGARVKAGECPALDGFMALADRMERGRFNFGKGFTERRGSAIVRHHKDLRFQMVWADGLDNGSAKLSPRYERLCHEMDRSIRMINRIVDIDLNMIHWDVPGEQSRVVSSPPSSFVAPQDWPAIVKSSSYRGVAEWLVHYQSFSHEQAIAYVDRWRITNRRIVEIHRSKCRRCDNRSPARDSCQECDQLGTVGGYVAPKCETLDMVDVPRWADLHPDASQSVLDAEDELFNVNAYVALRAIEYTLDYAGVVDDDAKVQAAEVADYIDVMKRTSPWATGTEGAALVKLMAAMALKEGERDE
jgi:hypothetical protein